MTTSQIENRLNSEKNRWEAIAENAVEQATIDAQSNFMFRKAQEKLTAIDRALQRIATGTFGRCDECGASIEPERLELLIDSDCHVCACCAGIQKLDSNSRPRVRRVGLTYKFPVSVMETA